VTAIVIGAIFALSAHVPRLPVIRHEWSGNGFAMRVVGEFRYALRDPATRANGALGLLLSLLIVVGALSLPPALSSAVEPIALLAIGVFASAAPRGIRGTFPVYLAPQRLIGISATSWALSTSLVVIGLTCVLLTPGLAL